MGNACSRQMREKETTNVKSLQIILTAPCHKVFQAQNSTVLLKESHLFYVLLMERCLTHHLKMFDHLENPKTPYRLLKDHMNLMKGSLIPPKLL